MYKKVLLSLGGGEICHAYFDGENYVAHTRESGRIVRRMVTSGGKVFGARKVGYGDAYFEYPHATVEIFGEEISYESK